VTAYQPQVDPTAVQGRRIGAWLIDVLIIALIGGGLWVTTVEGTEFTGVNLCEASGADSFLDSDDCDDEGTSTNDNLEFCTVDGNLILFSEDSSVVIEQNDTWLPNLVSFLYIVLVFWVLQGLTGLTPGKALFGIRTVNERGERPGILRAFLRWLLWIVDAFPYCCVVPLVGGIAMFASTGHRRVGDMVAKTYVVSKQHMGAGPIVVPGKDAPMPYAGPGVVPGAPGAQGAGVPPAPAGFAPPPGPFGAPATDLAAPAEPVGPTTPPSAAEGSDPQWDPQRNAFIQWDASQEAWLQFDDATQTWQPISTA
jgi:uncharacterized RDD family membrane protein YckC